MSINRPTARTSGGSQRGRGRGRAGSRAAVALAAVARKDLCTPLRRGHLAARSTGAGTLELFKWTPQSLQ